MAEKKPEARVVSEVCSICGLDWKRHGKTPTTETCIRLLASDLAAANERANRVPYSYPVPYPVYPRVYPQPYWGTITYQGGYSGGQLSGKSGYVNCATSGSSTPQLSSNIPHAVAA